MKPKAIAYGSLIAALALVSPFCATTAADAAQVNQADTDEGVQVLTRGPVHEAFAETINYDPEPGIVVPVAPPEAVEEIAPEQRPEGDNITWIPGYFAWDDEREDFLWVSGIWRDLPPGRQWMPGYWAEVESGYQWISGYWADASLTEIQYLPEPPGTVEVGPNIAAPSHDHVWLPGCWIWQQNRYAWQPGYWAPMQPAWDWVPAHYVCSPRGYVFVNGYYDYSVSRRGVLFAPVYFHAGVRSRRGYSYSPSIVIDLRLFNAHLFARPRYHHYYFGDYYSRNYTTDGFFPSFSYASSGFGYDPFYARQRWDNREDRDWNRRIEREFENRRDHEDKRPPRTLADLIERNRNAPESNDKSLNVAMSLDQLTRNQKSQQRFKAVDKDERQALVQRRDEMQRFRNDRRKLESETTATRLDNSTEPIEPVKIKLPKSPVVSTAAESPGKGAAPPKHPDTPKVDPNVVAEPRVPRESRPKPENAEDSKKGANTDTKSPDMKKTEPGSKSGKKGNAKSKDGKSAPKPGVPKANPKPGAPKIDPKPGDPDMPKPDQPKGDPKPKGGKGDPKPDKSGPPKVDTPKVNPPKVNPPKTKPPRTKPKASGGNADPKANTG